ncbi:helix-turn-helix domain-containing protein, partial [Hornefia butyriciproducens]|uniref:helix-turn-helix domain-containing protein n=1 Tax=Hornefia butyriciproducens TaxID=2652293 RepID=UPI003899EA21
MPLLVECKCSQHNLQRRITMDQVHSTTEQHVKGKHLTYDERMIIQIRHKEGCSPNRIAAEIGCAPNTVR